jgi:hypothetical protein
MQAKDYQARGGTFINTVYIDGRVIRGMAKGKSPGDAGAAP